MTCLACADNSDSSGDKPDTGTAADGGGGSGDGHGYGGQGGAGGETHDAGDDSANSNGGQGGASGQGGAGGSSAGGQGGSGSSGSGGASGSSASKPDIKPAECLPDPTNFTACGGSDVTQNVVVPKTCIGGKDQDCSSLGDNDTDPSDDDWTLIITESGDNCLMDAAQHARANVVGSFKTNGNAITVTDDDGPDTSDYCVDGDTLTVQSVSGNEVSWGVFTRE